MFEGDIILRALEGAIVKAFFEGYQVCDEHGNYRTVGGQFSGVVEAALQHMNFEDISKAIAERIKREKQEEIVKLASERFERLILAGEYKQEVRPEIMKAMQKVMVEITEKSPVFKRSVERMIDLRNFDISIQVKASPKKKR